MKYYWIDVYLRDSSSFGGTLTDFRWKAENLTNLRKRLVAEKKDTSCSYVVFEVPSDKGLMGVIGHLNDKGYKGTYNVKKIDGKNTPTWNVDRGNGWDYTRNILNKDGTLGRRL